MGYYSLEEGHVNELMAHKRTIQTITPSIALKDNRPVLAWGTPGADVQEQAKLQVFLNFAEFGMNVQEAIEAGRVQTYHPGRLMGTAGGNPRVVGADKRIDPAELEKLARMNYTVNIGLIAGGGLMGGIEFLPNGYKRTGSDNRGENYGAAW